jgi:hypothetical protein
MFSERKRSWYDEPGIVKIADYFNERFHFGNEQRTGVFKKMRVDIREILSRLEGACAESNGGSQGRTRREFVTEVLHSPESLFGNNSHLFTNPVPACIVHGDLHGGNVLVGDGNQPHLIDYATVGMGPRALDFATLEAGVRLEALKLRNTEGKWVDDPRKDAEVLPEIIEQSAEDADVWRRVWRNDESPQPGELSWQAAAYQIGRLAKENAREPGLTQSEYAATCLMWCIRLYDGLEDTSFQKKTRLLVWIAHLISVLE